MVEHYLAKVRVASSNLVTRSNLNKQWPLAGHYFFVHGEYAGIHGFDGEILFDAGANCFGIGQESGCRLPHDQPPDKIAVL